MFKCFFLCKGIYLHTDNPLGLKNQLKKKTDVMCKSI